LRGNVPTRINKLREGNYDAILLALAGVKRLELDLADLHVTTLDPTVFIPAPAQGVLGLQIREEDKELAKTLEQLNDTEVQKRIATERRVLKLLNGGCQLPLGVYCPNDDEVHVAFANDWKQGAIFKTYQTNQSEDIASHIVDELKSL
jgi:hydroxymethylbilane synthase